MSSSTALDGISASAAEPTCSNRSDSLSGLAPVRVNPVARCVSQNCVSFAHGALAL